MVEINSKKETNNRKLENKNNLESDEQFLTIDGIENESSFDILQTEDIRKSERVKFSQRIKGVERVSRLAEHPEKLTFSRIEHKINSTSGFNVTFMAMHTSEVTYDLIKKELIRFGAISDLIAEVNSGKEANIYIAHLNGSPLIVKVFRQQNTSHNKQKRRQCVNPQIMATGYAHAEFYRLMMAFKAGMNVPTPARKINNVIIMQFVGSNWEPAPQLRNILLENPEIVLDEIIEQLKIMYQKAKLIHGDFSEYNILIHNEKPIIIDFPQAIDMSLVVNRQENRINENLAVLQKDIETIRNYFEKEYKLTFDFKEVYQYVAGKDATREKLNLTMDEAEKILFENTQKKKTFDMKLNDW
ncbi:MAG: hypothetical protein JXA54_16665 [Candidatus Heimdallarchaeota archaeon]|nr:hypothetical protein [Candidatus Heimdallarchaeota archaeon]